MFKGTKNFYSYEISSQILYNLQEYVKYSLLELGAFTNVTFTSPASGYCNLQLSKDDRYPQGCVYEGLSSWVWETDVQPIDSSTPPIQCSGVYIDNAFFPSGSGNFIDFVNGRVIFNTPPTGLVRCQYTCRDVTVTNTDSQVWKTIITNYLDRYNQMDTVLPSGLSNILKEQRIFLPAVILETRDFNNSALQLGGGDFTDINVYYHIFSDKSFSSKRLVDFINNQWQTTIQLFDMNKIPQPFNFNGSLASGALTYKQLTPFNGPYYFTTSWVDESTGGSRDSYQDLFRGECRQLLRVQRYLNTY